MKAYCSLYDFLPSLLLITELNSFARVLDLLWRHIAKTLYFFGHFTVFIKTASFYLWMSHVINKYPNVWCFYLFRWVMSWSNAFSFASLISRTSMRSQRLMLCSVTMWNKFPTVCLCHENYSIVIQSPKSEHFVRWEENLDLWATITMRWQNVLFLLTH